MKKVSMRKYSLLGLILIGASAVTAAFTTPANDEKTKVNGAIVESGDGIDRTCEEGAGNECTITVEDDNASDTTTGLEGTSDVTRGGASVKTSTEVGNDVFNDLTSTSHDNN